MAYTRAAFNQDQERQKRFLSSLRINYFISSSSRRSREIQIMDPITPYSEKIDLRTEHGRKIYEACTKAIPVVFDAMAGKHHSFVTVLKNIADERCWRSICIVPVGIGAAQVSYDLLLHPGKISLADLQVHCAAIWNANDADNVQKQIKLNMMGVCLLNSVSASVAQRLDSDKEKWFFANCGGKDGLIIFKLLMQYSLQTTRYGSEATKDKLHNLNVKNFGNNVEEMLLHRKTLLDDLRAQGEVFNEDLYWAFKCLETIEQPETFKRYIEDKKSEWEEGGLITASELCKAAQTKFKHLLEAGKWKFANTTSGASNAALSAQKDDGKFIALAAAIKEIAKSVGRQPENPNNQKNKWKFEAPAAGTPIEKEVNGKLFWWCNGSDGKNHKPMFCRHKPTECKQQPSKQKLENSNGSEQKSNHGGVNNNNGGTTIASKSGPKLKLNNNLSTALAALDQILLNSTSSDAENSEDKDFM
jgi:hypothetical protein